MIEIKNALPEDAFAEYTFQLTGACNTEADWSALTEVTPSVTVVYSVDKHVEAPAAVAPSIVEDTVVAVTDVETEVTVDLGTGDLAATGIAKIEFVNPAGETKTMVAGTGYTYSDGKIKLSIGTGNYFITSEQETRLFTVTFDDEAGTISGVLFHFS